MELNLHANASTTLKVRATFKPATPSIASAPDAVSPIV